MSRILAAAVALLLSRPALALPEVTQDHWIIVTGSRDRKETERLLADVMKRWPARVHLQPGYPKIVESDGKTGLNPGFVIAVAGACPRKADAMAVQKELRRTIPGVYVRAVARYLPGAIPVCPRLEVAPEAAHAKPKVPKGYALESEGPAGAGGLAWKIYTAKAECGEDVLVQLLDAKGRLVDERNEPAHCVQGDPEEGDLGERKVWSASLAEAGYVMFTYQNWASDTGCNGGAALCPTPEGIVDEPLEGTCNSSGYTTHEDETHCGE